MKRDERITRINEVLADYFSKHKGTKVLAKDMMDEFVRVGIFISNHRDGLPIRRLLRELDDENLLHLIPTLSVERNSANRNWYFTDTDTSGCIGSKKRNQPPKEEDTDTPSKKRDEGYVIDLCDKVLNLKARRQHCFDFLHGDTGRPLPVDAYYQELSLVIEYRERQHTESVKFWNRMTASGIPRDEQRRRYDQRRRDLLPKNGIRLVEISYSDFQHNAQKRLLRIADADEQVVRTILHEKGLI